MRALLLIACLLLALPAWGQLYDYTDPTSSRLAGATQMIPSCTAPDALIVTPANFLSVVWHDPATRVFCMTPGDYTGLGDGKIRVIGNSEGTDNARRWIRRYDVANPEVGVSLLHPSRIHPWDQPEANRVRLRGLHLPGDGVVYTRFWIVTGLTFEGREPDNSSSSRVVLLEGDDLILDLYDATNAWGDEEAGRAAPPLVTVGNKTRDGADWWPVNDGPSRVWVQRGTVHDNMKLEEGGAIGISFIASDHRTVLSENVYAVDNEAWNNGDHFQLACCGGGSSTDPGRFADSGLYGNEFYGTSKWDAPCDYVSGEGMGRIGSGQCGCMEDAVDLKSGGLPGRPFVVQSNRLSRYRPTANNVSGGDSCGGSGSTGAALVTGNQYALYTVIARNLVWDIQRSIIETDGNRNMEYLYNQFGEITAPAGEFARHVQILSDGTRVIGNVFGAEADLSGGTVLEMYQVGSASGGLDYPDWIESRCNYSVSDVEFSAAQVRGPDIFEEDNAAFGGATPSRGGAWNTERTDDALRSTHNTNKDANTLQDIQVQWKRWTGPVVETIDNVHLPTPLCDGTEVPVRRGGGVSEGAGLSPIVPPPDPQWTWSPVRLGAGGFLTGVDSHSDGTRVVSTDTYGGYLWDSTASEWVPLYTAATMPAGYQQSCGIAPGVYALKVAPTNSSVLYMVVDGRAFKGARTGTAVVWTELTNFAQDCALDPNEQTATARVWGGKMVIHPTEPDTVYVGTSTGLRFTTDGGTTWNTVPAGEVPLGTAPPYINALCIEGTNVYAASRNNGVYRSTGGAFSSLSASFDDVVDGDCAAGTYFAADGAGDTKGTLWRYDGAWTDVGAGNGQVGSNSSVVFIDPFDATRVCIGTDFGSVMCSNDSGSTWNWTGGPNPLRVSSDIAWHTWTNESFMSAGDMIFDRQTVNRILFAQGIGHWYTDIDADGPNAAVPWTGLSAGIEQLVVNRTVCPQDASECWACVWDRGTFRMPFASLGTAEAEHGPTPNFNHCWDLTAAALLPTTLAQANYYGGTDWSAGCSGSCETQANWAQFTDLLGAETGAIARDGDNVLMASTGGLHRGTGPGAWTLITGFWADNVFFPNGLRLRREILAYDRVTPNKAYVFKMNSGVGGDNGIWSTANDGVTWVQEHVGSINSNPDVDRWSARLKPVPGNAGHLFFTAGDFGGGIGPPVDGQFFRSVDGGATWTPVSPGDLLEVRDFGFGDVMPGGSYPRICAAGYYDPVGTPDGEEDFAILISDDAGSTWEVIHQGNPLDSLDVVVAVDCSKDGSERIFVGFQGSGVIAGVKQ